MNIIETLRAKRKAQLRRKKFDNCVDIIKMGLLKTKLFLNKVR